MMTSFYDGKAALAVVCIETTSLPNDKAKFNCVWIVVIPNGKNEGIVKSFTSWGLRSNPQRVEDFRSLQFFPCGITIPFTLQHVRCNIFGLYSVFLENP